MKIILLASKGAGVGKTTTAREIAKKNPNTLVLGIAEAMRFHLNLIAKELEPSFDFFTAYTQSKNKPLSSETNVFKDVVLRDWLNVYSNAMQVTFGKTFPVVSWKARVDVLCKEQDVQCIVIDDWRRTVESNWIVETFGKDNVLTVYLSKPDVIQPVFNTISQALEGQIDPEECDIVFDFEPEWSNLNQLVEMLKLNL